MTPEELQAKVDSIGWNRLGEGAYNDVTISNSSFSIDGSPSWWWVVKKPKDDEGRSQSDPKRAVEKWRLFNPQQPAYVIKDGWIAPFLGRTFATDDQRAKKLIAIYRQTRNIVGDAGTRDNVLVFEGGVICVDVDHAFRRGSLATDTFDPNGAEKETYDKFLQKCSETGYPKTAYIVKVLFYLEKHLSADKIKDEYITATILDMVGRVRHADIDTSLTVDIMEVLLEIYHVGAYTYFRKKEELLSRERLRTNKTCLEDVLRSCVLDALSTKENLPEKIKQGNLDCFRVLKKYKPELLHQYIDGFTPLHIAAATGQVNIINFLIEEGADLSNVSTGQGCFDSNMTALELAIFYRRDDAIRALRHAVAIVKTTKVSEVSMFRVHKSPPTDVAVIPNDVRDLQNQHSAWLGRSLTSFGMT